MRLAVRPLCRYSTIYSVECLRSLIRAQTVLSILDLRAEATVGSVYPESVEYLDVAEDCAARSARVYIFQVEIASASQILKTVNRQSFRETAQIPEEEVL